MKYAEKILKGDVRPARDIGGEYFHPHKFSEMVGLEGKIIRETPSEDLDALLKDVKATDRLLGVYTDRYGIDTVNPQFVMAPGDGEGEASAIFICDKILDAKHTEELVDDPEMITAFDDLNLKLIRHVRDLYEEGGLYNTEMMHLRQYVVSEGQAVLVDVEPHFVRILAPPGGRIYGEVELAPIFDMVRELIGNVAQLKQDASRPIRSKRELGWFIEQLSPSNPVLARARQVLAESLASGNLDAMDSFFEDHEGTTGWNKLFHDQRAVTYVADL